MVAVSVVVGDGTAEVIVTGDDVNRLKPDTAAYLVALDELGLSTGAVMAMEDSEIGLHAARSAGLATLVVTDPEVIRVRRRRVGGLVRGGACSWCGAVRARGVWAGSIR